MLGEWLSTLSFVLYLAYHKAIEINPEQYFFFGELMFYLPSKVELFILGYK